MARVQNLIVDQGASFSTDLTITTATNTPYDLTGSILKGQIKSSYGTMASFDLTVADKGVPTTGVITISLTAVQSAAIPAGRYVYDVIMTNGSQVTRIIEGILTVSPSVTS